MNNQKLNKKVQIFPFFIQEGKLTNEIPEIVEECTILRAMMLEKINLDAKNWFFSDGTQAEKITFWKPCASETNMLMKGIELSTTGFKYCKEPENKAKRPKASNSNQNLPSLFKKFKK